MATARPIICLNDNKVFKSISLASKFYKIPTASVYYLVSHAGRSGTGKVFEFYFDDKKKYYKAKMQYYKENPIKDKRIGQYQVKCLNNNTVYESLSKAAIANDISKGSVSRVINGREVSVKELVFRKIVNGIIICPKMLGKIMDQRNKITEFEERKRKRQAVQPDALLVPPMNYDGLTYA